MAGLGIPEPRKSILGSGWSLSMSDSVGNPALFLDVWPLARGFRVRGGVLFQPPGGILDFVAPRGQNRNAEKPC